MPMSGGKRNHEDVSDTMALVQAACKVLAITARPFVHFRHRRQPVRSAIGAAAKPKCQWSRAARKSRAPVMRRGSRERVPYRNGGYGNARRDRNHQNSPNVHGAALRARGAV
jgi:hypothetical protein